MNAPDTRSSSPKIVNYLRVSRSDQNSSLQADETQELIRRRGWTLSETFRDEGISGSHDRRPGFQAMMAAARSRRFDVLVVYRADRLFRSLRNLVVTLEEFHQLGVGFVSVTEPFDTTTSAGRLLLQLVGAFAEFEREVLKERTRSGIAAARRRGALLGRPPTKFSLERAQSLRAGGMTFAAIARELGVGVAIVHRALVHRALVGIPKTSPKAASQPADITTPNRGLEAVPETTV